MERKPNRAAAAAAQGVEHEMPYTLPSMRARRWAAVPLPVRAVLPRSLESLVRYLRSALWRVLITLRVTSEMKR